MGEGLLRRKSGRSHSLTGRGRLDRPSVSKRFSPCSHSEAPPKTDRPRRIYRGPDDGGAGGVCNDRFFPPLPKRAGTDLVRTTISTMCAQERFCSRSFARSDFRDERRVAAALLIRNGDAIRRG